MFSMRCEVLMVVTANIIVSWDVTPCSLMFTYDFWRIVLPSSFGHTVEKVRLSETSAHVCQATLRDIPDDGHSTFLWNLWRYISRVHGVTSQNNWFLSAFATLRKATINFVVSVCLSVSPHGTTRFSLDVFSLNLIIEYFSKIRREN
jgi:hypothetical protein